MTAFRNSVSFIHNYIQKNIPQRVPGLEKSKHPFDENYLDFTPSFLKNPLPLAKGFVKSRSRLLLESLRTSVGNHQELLALRKLTAPLNFPSTLKPCTLPNILQAALPVVQGEPRLTGRSHTCPAWQSSQLLSNAEEHSGSPKSSLPVIKIRVMLRTVVIIFSTMI